MSMFSFKTDRVKIRNVADADLRALAEKADKLGNNDGVLEPEEAQKLLENEIPDLPPDFFEKVADTSNRTKLTDLAFDTGMPAAFGAIGRMARINVLWRFAFQAVGSGIKNMKAYDEGRISATRAVAETAVDTAIAGSAAAAGAAIGAAAGSVIPVAGTLAGLAIGAGAGYVIDHFLHKAVDPFVDDALDG